MKASPKLDYEKHVQPRSTSCKTAGAPVTFTSVFRRGCSFHRQCL